MQSGLEQNIFLTFSGENFDKLDLMSKSDPYVIVYQRFSRGDKWEEVGRTETIQNNSSPDFTTTISVVYYFEK